MNNLKYLDIVKEKLKRLGIAETYLEEKALLVINYSNDLNRDVMEFLDKDIDFNKLEPEIIKYMNFRKQYKTSVYGKSKGDLEPNKYIKRLIRY